MARRAETVQLDNASLTVFGLMKTVSNMSRYSLLYDTHTDVHTCKCMRGCVLQTMHTSVDSVDLLLFQVNFYIRGPHGAGKVYSEMFKDQSDKNWKFTYLIVEILSPSKVQLMLESYVPA